MSESSANSPALSAVPGEAWLPGPKPPSEGWTTKKFFFILAFVLVFHLALIFLFGTKKQIMPRVVTNVPHLLLADRGNELIALGDPTLFARPNAHDVVSAFWRRVPEVPQPNFDWTEPPRYLRPPVSFGAAFRDFVRNSQGAEFLLNLKPEPRAIPSLVPLNGAMPQATAMEMSDSLVARRLLNSIELPSLPRSDVVAPTTVQAVVDTAGNVWSTVVLKSSVDNDADQQALRLARKLRFAPAPRLTFGEITFTWHTVPTNAVPITVP
jgi:TonB family protein